MPRDSRNYRELLNSHCALTANEWDTYLSSYRSLILHPNHPHFHPHVYCILRSSHPIAPQSSSKLAARWNCPLIQNYYANPTLFFVGFSSTTSLPCFLLLFSRCFSTNFAFAASCIHEKTVVRISFYTSYTIQDIMSMEERRTEVKNPKGPIRKNVDLPKPFASLVVSSNFRHSSSPFSHLLFRCAPWLWQLFPPVKSPYPMLWRTLTKAGPSVMSNQIKGLSKCKKAKMYEASRRD